MSKEIATGLWQQRSFFPRFYHAVRMGLRLLLGTSISMLPEKFLIWKLKKNRNHFVYRSKFFCRGSKHLQSFHDFQFLSYTQFLTLSWKNLSKCHLIQAAQTFIYTKIFKTRSRSCSHSDSSTDSDDDIVKGNWEGLNPF